MNQPGNLIDEADIGSGEQENAEREALEEDIRKIPPVDQQAEKETDPGEPGNGPLQSQSDDAPVDSTG